MQKVDTSQMTNESFKKMAMIRQAMKQGSYRYTLHGAQQRIARGITRQEIEAAITNGEVIEDYPDHHYGPSCLVFGRTTQKRPLHIVCALEPMVAIITVYEPGFNEWHKDGKTRRKT